MSPDKTHPDPPVDPPPAVRQVPSGHAQILASGLGLDLFCQTLAHEAPDAIIYADVGGMIRFWNRGAERIFGYSPAEALGRSLDIIIPEELRARHWGAYGETMRTGQTRYGAGEVLAVPALRKGGARLRIEFTLLPFHGREGRVLGVAAILREVTRLAADLPASRGEREAGHVSPTGE
jgi:PAS domain S-box-containing protein